MVARPALTRAPTGRFAVADEHGVRLLSVAGVELNWTASRHPRWTARSGQPPAR
ncbi:hypothetical protein JNW90_05725 [Micromonospora sp. STR1s_5]|nr:hypothetical protein [Micromonospora sp. STR1s_5]